jgi:hypothetical protein
MMPAFGLTISREYLPRLVEVLDKVRSSSGHQFRNYMNPKQLDGMWKDLVLNGSDAGPVTIDAVDWLGRAALDV